MKICFLLLRPDANTKLGGDALQAHFIADEINKSDKVEVTIENWSSDWALGNHDLVHLFNDRPLFLYKALNTLKYENVLISISPIHHSYTEMLRLRMYSWPHTIFKKYVTKFIFFFKIEKSFVHYTGVLADLRLLHDLSTVTKIVKYLLTNPKEIVTRKKLTKACDNVDHFIFLAEGERITFQEDYNLRIQKYNVIPNGVTLDLKDNSIFPANKTKGIIVVGRIEPRKRQLEIAKFAKLKSIPITFVGALSPTQKNYGESFLKCIEGIDNIQYLGALPHVQVLRLIRLSQTLFSASLAEVLSLVEIEALAIGTNVVSTGAGYTSEYASFPRFKIYDSEDIMTGLEIANSPSEYSTEMMKSMKIFAWDEIASKYEKVFKQIVERE